MKNHNDNNKVKMGYAEMQLKEDFFMTISAAEYEYFNYFHKRGLEKLMKT